MRALILVGLVLLSMFAAGSPANSQTLEQAKRAQVEKSLSTSNGQIIKQAVDKYSKQYGMDPMLIHAVILTESGYNRYAKSSCGASGLMQMMPSTFKARNVGNNIWDIEQNIHGGVKHLAGLKGKYKGNIYLSLAAYNAGGGYVDKFGGKVPPKIQGYVNKVYYHKKIIESIAF